MISEVTVKTSMASTACPFLLRLALAGGLVLGFAMIVRGGGPEVRCGHQLFRSDYYWAGT